MPQYITSSEHTSNFPTNITIIRQIVHNNMSKVFAILDILNTTISNSDWWELSMNNGALSLLLFCATNLCFLFWCD